MERMRPDGTEVPLSQIAKHLGVDYTTVWMWAKKGRRGVKLRVCQHPFGMATSMKEYQLFLERLSDRVEMGSP